MVQNKNIFMKYFLFIFSLLHPFGNCFSQGIYDYSIIKSDFSSHSINEFQGKKIMIVVLPSARAPEDSSYLVKLDSVAVANAGSLSIIAVPSYEDGFTNDSIPEPLAWYQKMLGDNITVTQGMYTHRSTAEQHALFSWLTHASVNGHFDEEISGPGQMYFINETGELYGVFMPESKWGDEVLSLMLQQ